MTSNGQIGYDDDDAGNKPFVIILQGAPGSGKTTLAHALAAALSRRALPFLPVDTSEFQRVAPLYLPSAGHEIADDTIWTPDALVRYGNVIPRAVFQFPGQGFDVIVDGTWPLPPDAYDARADALAVYSTRGRFRVVNVGLRPSIEELLARRDQRLTQVTETAARLGLPVPEPQSEADLRRWAETIHAGHAYDLELDTGTASVGESVAQVAAYLDRLR